MPKTARRRRLQITVPRFDFPKLVLAHGWVFLAPFEWDPQRQRLTRPLRLTAHRRVRASVSVIDDGDRSVVSVRLPAASPLTGPQRQKVRQQVRRMLRLDEDFTGFHRLCADDPDLRFVSRCRCGGLLRAPSAFEDLIKTICTTNCDWRNTKAMCDALCTLADGDFPTAKELAAHSPRQLARVAPVGYRASTIVELARRSAEGQLDLEAWAEQGDFDRVRGALGQVSGVGPYTVSHMCVLLGAYDTIPVDSEVTAYLRRTHFGGNPVPVDSIVRPYEQYGRYRFLAFKFRRMGQRLNYIDK